MQSGSAKFKVEFKLRLYKWTLRLLKFLGTLPKESVTRIMSDQLTRSGTSILANYIEAISASSRKDFINIFTHSLKSANESKVWITLLRDLEKGNPQELIWLLNELIEIANVFASSILTMKVRK